MVDAVLAGYGRPASIIWPPQGLGHEAALDETLTYNLEMARQLLNEANWDPSTSVVLRVGTELRAMVAMAQMYQADLNAIGVNVALQQSSAPRSRVRCPRALRCTAIAR